MMRTLKEFIEAENIKVGDLVYQNDFCFPFKVIYIFSKHVIGEKLDGTEEWAFRLDQRDSWQPYQEPKKTKKLYQWAVKTFDGRWIENDRFFDNEHDAKHVLGLYGIKFKRLDHTMIEVEE